MKKKDGESENEKKKKPHKKNTFLLFSLNKCKPTQSGNHDVEIYPFLSRYGTIYRFITHSKTASRIAKTKIVLLNLFKKALTQRSHLRSAFSSGLRCVSLCLFRKGGAAALESLECEEEEMRSTLWAPPGPAATTTIVCLFSGSRKPD